MVDIDGIYFAWSAAMADTETGTAKLFKHGRSQAVRLPKVFRRPGTEVRVRRIGRSVLLEPMQRSVEDIRAIFAKTDRLRSDDFLAEGRPDSRRCLRMT
jgi:antitoxin VapB